MTGSFNYVDKNNRIFYPECWFKEAEDFREWDNGVVAARVFDGNESHFLSSGKNLYLIGKDSYRTENYQRVLKEILFEQLLHEHRDLLQGEREKFNFYVKYNPQKGGQLHQKPNFRT